MQKNIEWSIYYLRAWVLEHSDIKLVGISSFLLALLASGHKLIILFKMELE